MNQAMYCCWFGLYTVLLQRAQRFKGPLIAVLVWVLSLFHSCYLVLDCCSYVFMAENSDWRSGNKALFLEPCGGFTGKTVIQISTLSSIVPAHINPIPTSLRLRLRFGSVHLGITKSFITTQH